MNQTAPQHPPGAGKLKQGKQGAGGGGGGRRRRARSPALPVAWDSEARIGEGGSSSSGGGHLLGQEGGGSEWVGEGGVKRGSGESQIPPTPPRSVTDTRYRSPTPGSHRGLRNGKKFFFPKKKAKAQGGEFSTRS
jgi:hypothetical protein